MQHNQPIRYIAVRQMLILIPHVATATTPKGMGMVFAYKYSVINAHTCLESRGEFFFLLLFLYHPQPIFHHHHHLLACCHDGWDGSRLKCNLFSFFSLLCPFPLVSLFSFLYIFLLHFPCTWQVGWSVSFYCKLHSLSLSLFLVARLACCDGPVCLWMGNLFAYFCWYFFWFSISSHMLWHCQKQEDV